MSFLPTRKAALGSFKATPGTVVVSNAAYTNGTFNVTMGTAAVGDLCVIYNSHANVFPAGFTSIQGPARSWDGGNTAWVGYKVLVLGDLSGLSFSTAGGRMCWAVIMRGPTIIAGLVGSTPAATAAPDHNGYTQNVLDAIILTSLITQAASITGNPPSTVLQSSAQGTTFGSIGVASYIPPTGNYPGSKDVIWATPNSNAEVLVMGVR